MQEGYVNKDQWQKEFNTKFNELDDIYNEIINMHQYLSDENKKIIDNFAIENYHYISDLNSLIDSLSRIKEQAIEQKNYEEEQERKRIEEEKARAIQTQKVEHSATSSTNSQSSYNSSNFESQGVINWNGTRYTYYSSNVLYHYRTPEWTAGSDGIYRDSNGYIVVASNDASQGSIVSTPFGQGKVYDSGCASGTVDIYTNF